MPPNLWKQFRLAVLIHTNFAALALAGLIGVGLAAMPTTATATAGINSTLNFQGRLLTATGAVVPDGNYNMTFKIYQDGAGTAANNGGSGLKWTEKWENQSSNGITVKNGYFSLPLSTLCAFTGGSCQGNTNTAIDWNQSVLWLSMNVGGTTAGSPTYDGELLPMRRLASSVYALNSGLLGGLTAAQFLQLAQGIQSDSSTTQPSIGVNKTAGSQNLITLQSSGTDVFDVSSTGNLTFGNNADKTISVTTAASGNNGNKLTIKAGDANGAAKNGGDVDIIAGANGAGGTAGKVQVRPSTDSTPPKPTACARAAERSTWRRAAPTSTCRPGRAQISPARNTTRSSLMPAGATSRSSGQWMSRATFSSCPAPTGQSLWPRAATA
jgi:hypothetical protein